MHEGCFDNLRFLGSRNVLYIAGLNDAAILTARKMLVSFTVQRYGTYLYPAARTPNFKDNVRA